jgi:hypothetical protein
MSGKRHSRACQYVAAGPRVHRCPESKLLDEFRRDLQCGFRNLRKNPGFTAVAVATLAVGIGATTAVFSIVDAALFEAFPYQDSRRLVLLFDPIRDAPLCCRL